MWTPEMSLGELDESGTAAAVLSLTRPGIWFGDVAVARQLARESNEYAAQLVRDHPRRLCPCRTWKVVCAKLSTASIL